MQLMLSMPINTTVGLIGTRCGDISMAREKVVDYALSVDARYVLIVDDDTAPPPIGIQRLMETISMDPKIAAAGGIYFTRTENPVPVVGRKRGMGPAWDWKRGDRFDSELMGIGFMMIKTDIFRLIPKPWFPVRSAEQEGSNVFTEDDSAAFCRKVNEAGFRVIADAGVICGHYCGITGMKYLMPENFGASQLQNEPVTVYDFNQR
jgi:GT2 family glycosyltransferase